MAHSKPKINSPPPPARQGWEATTLFWAKAKENKKEKFLWMCAKIKM
jgi:hypothetical protein